MQPIGHGNFGLANFFRDATPGHQVAEILKWFQGIPWRHKNKA